MEDHTQPPKSSNSIIIGISVFVLIAIVTFTLTRDKTNSINNSQTPMTQTTTPTLTQNSQVADGTYQATGSYTSPAGPETIDISLTIIDGVITESTFVSNATNASSVKFQGMFGEGYKDVVIGQSITTLKLDKVSGSSLTPKGFNDAVDQILTQASQS
jgi:uncharacterized protein with FMN-binding domain